MEKVEFYGSQQHTPIHLSPLALFQVVKDIQSGSGLYHDGVLIGIPADPRLEEAPIEVSSAYPVNTSRFISNDLTDQQREEAKKATERDEINHLKRLKRGGFDCQIVGLYTSRNFGRALDFEDVKDLFDKQKREPNMFYLVVDIIPTSISVRAFRLSDVALHYVVESRFDSATINAVPDCMLFENFIVELPVEFLLTELDQQLLNQMIDSHNLVADVFHIRNLDSFAGEVSDVASAITSIDEQAEITIKNNKEVEDNIEARKKWIADTNETNAKRQQSGLSPIPLTNLDASVPPIYQSDKKLAITALYKYTATTGALREQLQDEQRKLNVLAALAASN